MLEQPETTTAARALPTGTVAFLFTDIEGSTQRWEAHRAAMADAIRRHDSLLEQSIAAQNGYVFKRMGDAFCAVFRTAPEAIAAACDAQRALSKEDFSAVDGLKVRMAVHVGHADEHNGDYFGPTVNRVARLLGVGYGGQVLVSGAAADLAQGEMPAQTALRDLGLHRLKDLAHPEQVYQLVAPDLAQKFFPLRSLDALPNNLPLQLTSFVGREDEIENVKSLVNTHRLTTLVGTGGVGKTRLALQVGADLLDHYEDGVWFLELAPLSDGTLILSELAPLFGVEPSGDRPLLDTLLAALRPKHTLLIVDNCEHLVDPAAEIVEKILRGAPNVRVLATSREALKIAGETVHRVASLDESAAIALFADRANAATDSFVLSDANRGTVAKICRRLDGIALAIELAAARVRAVDVEELFARLDERFRILTGGSRTALPRQQTMRALIDWSYDLLSAQEQALLRRVAVFAGGWTLEAATAICADDEMLQSWDVLDQLTSLVDKSLVVAEIGTAGAGSKLRYRLLESTRQYAAEKLEASGERDRLRRVHAEYFMHLAERADEEWSRTPSRAWLPPLDAEIDNFRVALDWALAEKQDAEIGTLLAAHLWCFWRLRSRAEGQRHLNSALELRERLSAPTVALLWFGHSAVYSISDWMKMRDSAVLAKEAFARLGDARGAMRAEILHGEALTRLMELEQSKDALTQALIFFTERGEARWANQALLSLARNATWAGDWALAKDRYNEAVAQARLQGDDNTVSISLNNLAECEYNSGNVARAIEVARELLARERELGQNPQNMLFTVMNLSAYLIATGQLDEAHVLANEALRKAVDVQFPVVLAASIQHLATIAAMRGDHRRAALLVGFTNTILNSSSMPREKTEQMEYDRTLNAIESALGKVQAAELLKHGEVMTQDQAVSEALNI